MFVFVEWLIRGLLQVSGIQAVKCHVLFSFYVILLLNIIVFVLDAL